MIKAGFKCVDTNHDGGHHFYRLAIGNTLFDTPYECEDTVLVDGSDIEIKDMEHLQKVVFCLTGKTISI